MSSRATFGKTIEIINTDAEGGSFCATRCRTRGAFQAGRG